jgi:prepilin-type N-terminal cleavage/methylation domain-containing protein
MNRLRSEDGFTLPELLTTLSIAVIISLATFALLDFTIKRTGEVAGRVEATQKGRGAMDTITQELRSQVCLNSTTPPLATAKPAEVTFYTDLSNPADNAAPEMHTLVYDPDARTLVDRTFRGTRAGSTITYPAAPDVERVLAENVVPETPTAPIFEYYAFDSAVPPRPTLELTSAAGLIPTDLARTVRMQITFRVLPPQTPKDKTESRGSVLLHDDVYVRAADPDDPRDVRAPSADDEVPPVCT